MMYDIKRFALAIIYQAVKDARAGDPDAAEWVLEVGASWLDILDLSYTAGALRAACAPRKRKRARAGGGMIEPDRTRQKATSEAVEAV